jgi:hypothetical protein
MRPKSKFRYVNHDLWAVMERARKQVPMGDGFVATCDHLEFPLWNLPVRLAHCNAADWPCILECEFS